MSTLLDEARDYLIAQGLVRKPRVAGAAYPLWIEPREGAPGPRNPQVEAAATTESNDDLVISAFKTTGVAVERHRGWEQIQMIEFWFRGRTYPLISDFYTLFRPKFADKRSWTMGTLYVLESLNYTELQRIGADENGWTFTAEFSFELFQP